MRGETDRMRPIMLVCETVNHCNSDCVFCPYSSQTRARGVMEMELFEQVVSQYSQIGGGNLSLTPTVGEALLDGMWMRRIHTLAAWQDRIAPSVTTNLYALDRYPDEEVRAMLSVLRRIHISCYGMTAGECETITRHPHLLDRFLAQTRRLLSLREASGLNCEVVIGFRLLQPRTEEEVCAFLREEFDLVPPHGATTTYANKNNFAQNALPGEAQWFPDHANSSTCSVLTMAGVYWDGRVSACPCQDYDASPQLYLGDLTKQSLSEAFNSPQSQALWRAHESGQLPPVCRNCSRHGTLSELGPSHPLIRSPLDLIGG
jgi:radical SAM protein with 4Fe4S-binding SPASM domain